MNRRLLSATLAAAMVAGLGILGRRRYTRDLADARESSMRGRHLLQSCSGTIAYAIAGSGPPVLVVHGAGGGHDQGLGLAAILGDGFQWIAPSRFGYPGTSLPSDPSPAAQADAHAALLDELGIERASIIGASAGGPSSLAFAARYPDRCSALVMISAVSHRPPAQEAATEALIHRLFGSDVLVWATTVVGRRALLRLFGVSRSAQSTLTAEERQWLISFLQTLLPARERLGGIKTDSAVLRALAPLPLERVHAPTLVVHALDDLLVPFEHAKFTSQHIPDARLLALPSGGHLLVGQHEHVRRDVVGFLIEHDGE